MPRKPRNISSKGIYHIILRSVNQHIIFEEESDYTKFLLILSDCKEKYDSDVYAYCLMDNHIHLLLYSPPDKLSYMFQSLGTRFARWYNTKYSRTGHLFQERFFSCVIGNNKSFLSVMTYIHNNPVKANICRFPSEYKWSSYNAYYGAQNQLVNVSFAYGISGSKEALLRYFATRPDCYEDEDCVDVPLEVRRFISDEQALIIFKSVTKLSTTSDVIKLPKVKRNEFIRLLSKQGLTIKQLARVMDVSPSTVKRVCKMDH